MAIATEPREEIGAELKALVKHLGDNTHFVAELPKQFNPILLSQAWINGLIEFGRRTHILAGKPGPKSETVGTMLIVEDSTDWSGFKRKSHKATKDLLAEDDRPFMDNQDRPYVEFQKYIPLTGLDPLTQKPYPQGSFQRVKISEDEARKMIRLQVRIADKGFEQLRVA